ncbi:DUF6344 domain-containing protein [Streptomyces sp. NPDC047014]|uniref:DUF6344 domain-containing protein n=1 Tax=Streptomyces sp. NPDC047014 TaxID=3155736 RepID=UPI0034116D2E
MAQRTVLTSIWTSVLAALVALLSSLGFGAKTAPAAVAAAAPAAPAPVASAVRPAVAVRRSWREVMRGGALPPTIKQRIRAEAHGKTPAVRRSTTAAAMGAGAGAAASSAGVRDGVGVGVGGGAGVGNGRAGRVPGQAVAGRVAAARETLALAA